MRNLFVLLFAAVTFPLLSQIAENDVENLLNDGDLIFQDMDCGPLCDAIEAVTEGYHGKDFSHMGMVYHRNDTIYVIEAAGSAVRLTTLDKFSGNTKKNMPVMRLKVKYSHLVPVAIAFSLKQLGVPYDDEYVYDNGAYYCSELIYDAFMFANGGKPFFDLTPMTYKQPGSNNFFPAWVDYYNSLNKPIPEGLPGCNPGGMSKSNALKPIFSIPAKK
ncbi:YiiX/YebB-like N1pC/P60 family cysteine hydrolase [uncultured Flavobacterium sp.]|uniref:YiiX/YebB-like N1pC/P60 family cysteine hydrolase n=1 Tax=uncultured Flavobacterium sp. TaxID=165435 RepID=UPI0025D4CA28|nr:YiiX/YebB-like N1pC/P60 family cysteine hydrolase [uncultured Flavobacterium sp.]